MEVMHALLDFVLPPAAFIGLLLTWPAIAFGNIVYWLVHLFKREQLKGKVVLITGASSGIGENLAYEYAKRGVRLVLAARRESKLKEVAERAQSMGASDTLVVTADVCKREECKHLIEATINRFGQLDHLVLNAGVANSFWFEDAKDTAGFAVTIDCLFWGSVYPAYYALPYLRQRKGRIVAVSSVTSWLPYPRQAFYNAGKAAVFTFFDSLRTEVGDAVGITIATPGWIESEITQGKFVSDTGEQEQRDVHVVPFPVLGTTKCAEAIVSGAERKMRYVIVPFWYRSFLPYRIVVPEVLDWFFAKVAGKPQPTKTLFPASLQKKE